MIFLPLLVWGMERLVTEQRAFLYVASLAGAIITNFYTGYMLCIFSVLYFLCYFFLIAERKREVRTVMLYAGSSLLGGALSAFTVLPMLASLSGGKSSIHLGETLGNFSKLFGYTDLIRTVYAGTVSGEQITGGMPLLYCGILSVLLAGYWFVRARASWKEKAAYLILLLFLVVSFAHYNLNCMWHGFATPMGSPYRFSFLFSFLLLYLAHKGFHQIQEADGKWEKLVLLCIAVGMLLTLFLEKGEFLKLERQGVLLLNVLFLLAYAAVLLAPRKKEWWSMLCLGLTCAELFGNALYLYTYSNQYQSISVTDYQDYLQKVTPLTETVKEEGEGLFRTVMTGEAYRTSNDSLLLNLYGLDSYTSVEKSNTMLTARNLGYAHSIQFGMNYGGGATKASESLLGVKYVIAEELPGTYYVPVKEEGNLKLYENPNALPFAFLAEASLLELDDGEARVFEYLNEIYRKLDGNVDADIFQEVGMQETETYQCAADGNGGYLAYVGATDAYVEYEIEQGTEEQVYLQYLDAGAADVEVIVKGDRDSLGEQGNVVKRLGELGTEKVRLRFYLSEGQAFYPDKVYLYGEREEILSAYAKQVSEQQVKIACETDSKIRIDCTNEKNVTAWLICTVPFEKGWKIKVDGKAVAAEKAVTGLTAVPVEPGTHEIEMVYVPQGLYPGIAVSLAGILILLLFYKVRSFLHLHSSAHSYYNVHESNLHP